ncbi:hypothetical protein LJC07_02475 [Christensenellaceae bacterium OttesenSCG-928-L17]|nr:hypothetical protein [Christensenellaceae bacterium OttesenSCG-928-L17]
MKQKTIRFLLCVLCALFALSGCKKEEPLPDDNGGMTVDNPGATSVPEPTGDVHADGDLTLKDSVAYVFEGMLYGGITYTNKSTSAMALNEAVFSFSYSGGSKEQSLLAFAPDSDILLPGETASAAIYVPLSEGESVAGDISLTVTLRGERTEKLPQRLVVSDAMLIQNYPHFATLTGNLENPTEDVCNLNMVYAQFYDEADKLLGVWYFSRNAIIQPGNSVPFAVHLTELPIEGLAENTASIRFYAYGIS